MQYGVENCSSKLWIKVKEKLLNILEQLKQSLDAPNWKCYVGQLWGLKLDSMYDSSGVPLMGLRDPCVHWVPLKVLFQLILQFVIDSIPLLLPSFWLTHKMKVIQQYLLHTKSELDKPLCENIKAISAHWNQAGWKDRSTDTYYAKLLIKKTLPWHYKLNRS